MNDINIINLEKNDEGNIIVKEMTKEDIDNLTAEETLLAKLFGCSTIEEFGDFRYHAAEGMMRFGGSFCHMLGHVLARADSKNSAKIVRTWPMECIEHAELHRKFLYKRDQEEKA